MKKLILLPLYLNHHGDLCTQKPYVLGKSLRKLLHYIASHAFSDFLYVVVAGGGHIPDVFRLSSLCLVKLLKSLVCGGCESELILNTHYI